MESTGEFTEGRLEIGGIEGVEARCRTQGSDEPSPALGRGANVRGDGGCGGLCGPAQADAEE